MIAVKAFGSLKTAIGFEMKFENRGSLNSAPRENRFK